MALILSDLLWRYEDDSHYDYDDTNGKLTPNVEAEAEVDNKKNQGNIDDDDEHGDKIENKESTHRQRYDEAEVPWVIWSDDPGCFVCNYLYYYSLYTAKIWNRDHHHRQYKQWHWQQ